jgi:hypothetical protein
MSHDDLRAKAKAATPGPKWCTGLEQEPRGVCWWACGRMVESEAAGEADAAFIAAASPEVVLGLLDERDAIHAAWKGCDAERDELRAEVARLNRLVEDHETMGVRKLRERGELRSALINLLSVALTYDLSEDHGVVVDARKVLDKGRPAQAKLGEPEKR